MTVAVRECTYCPPEVEACVHFGGEWLILHKVDPRGSSDRYIVCRGLLPPRFSYEGPYGHNDTDDHSIEGYALTKEEGLVLLREAEARLLSGEAPTYA